MKNKFPILKFFFSLILVLPLSHCLQVSHYPTTGPVTVTINNIFINCHNPLSSTKPITYSLTFTVYYYDGGRQIPLTPITVSSANTNPSSTVTFTAQFPNDGRPTSVTYDIYGTQCSTCAATQYGFNDYCYQTQSLSPPLGTYAARPVIHFVGNEVAGVYNLAPTVTFNALMIPFGENVANSCGCLVPNN
ncbi:MAG TPA: hypothetical protein VK772_06060 [Puia sp.]|jgi:hypothetical protein|nr:hypothetical protein [Puia sp.]